MPTQRLELQGPIDAVVEATRAVLSTIMFHRLFGSLAPTTEEVLGVTYPATEHAATNALLNEKTRELAGRLRERQALTVAVRFYDHKVKRASWFARTHEVCWEQWNLDVQIGPDSPLLERAILKVLHLAESADHIPPITTKEVAPFPFDISVGSRLGSA